MDNSNYLYGNGDVLYIQTRPNGRGSFHITEVVLNLSGGVSDSSSVAISLRTIGNGVIKSEWFDIETLATTNETTISGLSYDVPRDTVIQIRLRRIGDGENIRFESFEITGGTYFIDVKQTPTIDSSMFSDINHQYETDDLENNLFKKLYFRGIVPNYIKRGENRSKEEDEDYIALFSTIARFFTLIIRFFKRWEKINNYEEMLKEILRNNGIQFNESKTDFDHLSFLVHNIYSELSKRGTLEIFRLEGDERPDGTIVGVDGELIRTINGDKATEVLFETIFRYEMGWCLSKSSPMYRGIPNFCLALDKLHLPNNYSDIHEWDNILTFGSKSLQLAQLDPGNIAQVVITNCLSENYKHLTIAVTPGQRINLVAGTLVTDYAILKTLPDLTQSQSGSLDFAGTQTGRIRIDANASAEFVIPADGRWLITSYMFNGVTRYKPASVTANGVDLIDTSSNILRFSGASGIGRTSDATDASDYLIKVDSCMDYEIMIGFRVIDNSGNLYASVEGFSFYKMKLLDSFIMPDRSEITPDFFNSDGYVPLSSFIANKWYYVRFIIKAYSSEPQSSYTLNIGRGNELFFNNAFVRYILPTIRITGGTIDVCNFHMRPLVRGTNINRITGEKFSNSFSLGFLKTSRFFHLYLRNRSTTMSQDDIEDFINEYLLTYSSTNLITFID